MAYLAANATGTRAVTSTPIEPIAKRLQPGAPVTLMLHGYRFSPFCPSRDPHATMFAPRPAHPDRRAASWCSDLGMERDGLAVGFGWRADRSIWQADAEAARAGQALADLIMRLRGAGAPAVNLIGHSLGARVALCALPHLSAGDVARIVLLSAAELHNRAAMALGSPAGRAAEVLNVTSRENDPFDLMFELLIGGPFRKIGPALGEGLHARNAVTLQIDNRMHRNGLMSLGFPTAPPTRRVCHWSACTKPGLFPLYRRFLHQPDLLPLAQLRAALPEDTAPRWSRLFSGPLQPEPIAAT